MDDKSVVRAAAYKQRAEEQKAVQDKHRSRLRIRTHPVGKPHQGLHIQPRERVVSLKRTAGNSIQRDRPHRDCGAAGEKENFFEPVSH